jgi:Leucine-rich repeat (LRR) protein
MPKRRPQLTNILKHVTILLLLAALAAPALSAPVRAEQTQIPPEEYAALVALKNSIPSVPWTFPTDDPCSLSGVTCTYGTLPLKYVEYINLYGLGPGGSIPPELGNLTYLKSLMLGGLGLTGSIPPELGNMTRLWYLYLHDNNLQGGIPPQLGNLSKLRWLQLSNNKLSGAIPNTLGNLPLLQWLLLSSNQLNGVIPWEIGNLSSLQHLYLHDNQLIGAIPGELGNLTSLQELFLRDNHLSGPIPPQLGNLDSVTNLYLDNNQLIGPIPAELGGMAKLGFLCLNNNQLEGTIPPQLGNLGSSLPNTTQKQVYLNNNQLGGPIPQELGNLGSVIALRLDNNQLIGAIPPELGNLVKLVDLRLSSNQLTGQIPAELGNLGRLSELHLDNNQLGGTIPPQLGNLGNLSLWRLNYLHLHNNHLDGAIPAELANLTKLRSLRLDNNLLDGTIPTALGSLSSLQSLYLNNNLLSGAIPAELGNATALRTLNLAHNALEGPAPTAITQLANLGVVSDAVPEPVVDFGYNHLWTLDTVVHAFLDAKDPDWAETQLITTFEVSSSTGGILNLPDSLGGYVSVEVPAGSVAQPTTLVIEPLAAPAEAPGGMMFADQAFSLDAYVGGVVQEGQSFVQPLFVTLAYSDEQVAGLDEASLALYYWDGATWMDVATTCSPASTYVRDLAGNTLGVSVCHLSDFALFGAWAVYTTDCADAPVANMTFDTKDDVYLYGALPNGEYWVRVTDQGGRRLLGISGGPAISVTSERFSQCYSLCGILKAFASTPNPWGQYKVWVSADPSFRANESYTFSFEVLY